MLAGILIILYSWSSRCKKDQVPTERVKIGLLVDVRLIIYLLNLFGGFTLATLLF